MNCHNKIKHWFLIIKKVLLAFIAVIIVVIFFMAVLSLISYLHRREIVQNREQVQIAVFGDSIWDLVRDETGIAEKTEKYLMDSAHIYNCSIMGSTATELSDATTNFFAEIEPKQLDYVIFAYGLNDYFSAVPISSENPFDTSTYQGALRYGIQSMRDANPEIEIMIIAPTYCQVYSYGKVVSDSYDQDYGGGTGEAYALAAKEVAEEMGVTFVDMFHELKINRRNGLRYLVDATHLTEKGREEYAKILGDTIISLYKNDSE
jgi:lysophospholipase L1-like esterase